MVLRENPRYKIHKIYSNRNGSESVEKKIQNTHESELEHKAFVINGIYDFDGLDLSDSNWTKLNQISLNQKKFLETTPGYESYKEDIIYKGPQGNAIMHLNYKTNIHKLKINLNMHSNEIMNNVKNMFESGLGCTCYDEDNLPEGLIAKIRIIERANANLN